MRTTISIADELFQRAQSWLGNRSFSEFASEAIYRRVAELARERLAQEMDEGYRAEAERPSLDPEWSAVEVDGL